MTLAKRAAVLRADAVFLMAASVGGLATDLAGAFLQRGLQSRVLAAVPAAAIGFVEAHGLALILGIVLWRARVERAWHLTAAGIHQLLGTANLVFWPLFITADMLMVGYLTTTFHGLFLVGQLVAAATAGAPAPGRARNPDMSAAAAGDLPSRVPGPTTVR
jgi:hypothetical protein